jgi:hypothetical protein
LQLHHFFHPVKSKQDHKQGTLLKKKLNNNGLTIFHPVQNSLLPAGKEFEANDFQAYDLNSLIGIIPDSTCGFLWL